eukprot:TRINITY_DN18141_c0_g1_i1.p1 TRINITY_DN18141_c0_g1~~TRINITY_DN18141_c0_g1_i1.p1  ORF type:complete len:254 (+),score=54.28 TRINITY_DN18141_c0_g1_i1:177-938(+)
MPIEIRTPDDITKLDELIKSLVNAVKSNQLDEQEISQSAARIVSLKNAFELSTEFDPINAVVHAKSIIGNEQHRQVEAELALAAITQVKNTQNTLPLNLNDGQHIHIIMPDTRKCMAMHQAIESVSSSSITFSCSSLQGFDSAKATLSIKTADVVIAGNATPNQSAVEIGGMDDLADNPSFALNNAEQPKALESLLAMANKFNKRTVFISLRAPYDIAKILRLCSQCIGLLCLHIDVDKHERVSGPAFPCTLR